MKYVHTAALVPLALAGLIATASAQTPNRPLWEYAEPIPVLTTVQPSSDPFLPIKSYGPSGSPSSNGNGGSSDTLEFGDSERGSMGCLAGGVLGTAGALYIGGENIINLIAGGLVVPTSPAALYASLFGVVFASFCAVGQAMTPAVVYAYRRYFEEREETIAHNAPPARNREPLLPGLYQKSVYDPAIDPAFYVR